MEFHVAIELLMPVAPPPAQLLAELVLPSRLRKATRADSAVGGIAVAGAAGTCVDPPIFLENLRTGDGYYLPSDVHRIAIDGIDGVVGGAVVAEFLVVVPAIFGN